MTDRLFYDLGLILPPISIAADETLEGASYRYEWNDLRLPSRAGLPRGKVLVNETPNGLKQLNLIAQEAVNPANGNQCAIVDASYGTTCERAGFTTWDALGFAVLGLEGAIRNAADAFVGGPLLDLCLLRLSELDPELVQLCDESGDRDLLIQILRGLLAEEISIRDLSRILNWYICPRFTCTADFSKIIFNLTNVMIAYREGAQSGPREFIDYARVCQHRYISHKYTYHRGQEKLFVYLLNPTLEEYIRRTDELGPSERRIILKAVRDEMDRVPPRTSTPVILTTLEVRHRFRMSIYPEIHNLAVLSYQELSPDANIEPVGRISADGLASNANYSSDQDWGGGGDWSSDNTSC
jgi:type III secretion protein V